MSIRLTAALVAGLCLTAPLAAQEMDHAHHHDDSAAAPAKAAARFTLDTPVESIAADEQGKAVLDADLPGLTTHEHYPMFKAMSLNQIAALAPDKVTAEMKAKVEADLAAVK